MPTRCEYSKLNEKHDEKEKPSTKRGFFLYLIPSKKIVKLKSGDEAIKTCFMGA